MFRKFWDKLGENKKNAILLIILFGIISLLGDIIYEGARSVNGPYLQTLGASATIVGIVIGAGELLGYAIRLFSGYFSDKKKAHWLFTIIGYGLLISVPLLMLSSFWQFAAVFIILERIGKGLRSPARDTIVSHATKQVGTGFGFGISEFLDQIGAVIGPLIFTILFVSIGASQKTLAHYQLGYSLFWLPFVLLMLVLFFAYFKFKNPEALETQEKKKEPKSIPKVFWIYSIFSFITALGFINFAIIGYHLKITGIFSDAQIPLFYAFAMIIDAIFGVIIGRAYDTFKIKLKNEKAGLFVLALIPISTALILLSVFSSNILMVLAGIFLWGVVMGAHETVMKAAIADLTAVRQRGTAYGAFNVVYGLALFLGSSLAGFLYDTSIMLLVIVFVCIQAAALLSFFRLSREIV